MYDIGAVQEVHSAQEVVHDGHHVALRKRIILDASEHTAQVLVVVLHDDEDVVEGAVNPSSLAAPLCRNHDVNQFGSEQIILHLRKLSQNRYFSDHLAGLVAVSEDIRDLLDGDHFARFEAPGFDDLAEAAGADVG